MEDLSASIVETFFPNGTLFEASCRGLEHDCPGDVVALQPLTYRWLAVTTQIAPFTADIFTYPLEKSAEKVLSTENKDYEGLEAIDGMIALSAVSNLLIADADVVGKENDSGSNKTEEGKPESTSEDEQGEGNAADGLKMSVCLILACFGVGTFMHLAF